MKFAEIPQPDPQAADAMEVSDFMLRVTQEAYLARDFEAFSKWFHLPQIVGTFDGDRVLHNREDLRAVFDAMCAQMDAKAVVDIHRRTIEATYLDPVTIQATFVSRFIMNGPVLDDESVAHGMLRLIGGRWQIVESRYASADTGMSKALHTKARKTE